MAQLQTHTVQRIKSLQSTFSSADVCVKKNKFSVLVIEEM